MTDPRYIPNSFQTPNVLIDEIQPLLTLQEFGVLMFAVRQILGWQNKINDRTAIISVRRFSHCGMDTRQVMKALDGLSEFGLLRKVGEPTAKGQSWELCFDERVDIEGLQDRLQARIALNRELVQKRIGLAENDCGLTGYGVGLQDTAGVGSQDTAGVACEPTIETHIQTQGKTHNTFAGDAATPADPIIETVSEPKPKRGAKSQPTAVKESIEDPSSPVPPPPSSHAAKLAKPKASREFKEAIASLCYGSEAANAWKTKASLIVKMADAIWAIEPDISTERFAAFETWWRTPKWRGQTIVRPKLHMMVENWLSFRADSNPQRAPIAPSPVVTAPPPPSQPFVPPERFETIGQRQKREREERARASQQLSTQE